jgi:hypothetical protein
MLDKALRLTFKNYSTLVLVAAVFSIPVSLVYCFVFRGAIAVGELHNTILAFPGKRQVAGVGHDTLIMARWVGWGIVLLGVLSLLFLARPARRVLERDDEGHAPTVVDSLRNRPSRSPGVLGTLRENPGVVAIGAIVAIAVGWLALQAGMTLSEILSEKRLWTGVAITRGLAWSLAAPFVLVPLALSSRT